MYHAMPLASITSWNGKVPKLGEGVFLANGAHLSGDLVVGDGSSFWFNTTVRADANFIRIGARTNVQDGTVIHVTYATGPTHIGNEVTIGHNATIHACTIHDHVLVGMGAVILDGAVIRSNSYIGAGSIVPPNKEYPEGVLILGSPAKVVRDLRQSEIDYLKKSVEHYQAYAAGFING